MSIKTILIVDDSESDHYICVDVIECYNPTIKVLQAFDGKEALVVLDNIDTPPCLIFLDINMPGMNGFEFLEEYEKRKDKSKIVAMLTSSSQAQDKQTASKFTSIKAFLEKPLDEQTLSEFDE